MSTGFTKDSNLFFHAIYRQDSSRFWKETFSWICWHLFWVVVVSNSCYSYILFINCYWFYALIIHFSLIRDSGFFLWWVFGSCRCSSLMNVIKSNPIQIPIAWRWRVQSLMVCLDCRVDHPFQSAQDWESCQDVELPLLKLGKSGQPGTTGLIHVGTLAQWLAPVVMLL